MKSRFQKKNLRKSRRQSLRRKIQRGGQEINCNDYPWPRTCPPPCKRFHLTCHTEEQYNVRKSEEERREELARPARERREQLERESQARRQAALDRWGLYSHTKV